MISRRTPQNILAYLLKEKNTKVVFLGHQKSGTTAISALFSEYVGLSYSSDPIFKSSPSTSLTLDSFLNNEDEFNVFLNNNKKLFYKNSVKDPDFILNFPLTERIYPYAHFVFISRDPHQIIRSIFNRLKLDGNSKKDTVSKDEIYMPTENWLYMLNGKHPKQDGLSIISRLAERIEASTKYYLENKDKIHHVSYEDFKREKLKSIENLALRLGFEKKKDITSHLEKNFQPPGNNNIEIKDFFGQENYDDIAKICKNSLRICKLE
ncbi:sulfotransferase [Alteromonas sp. H39]|uniref:sulfotransferase n=1 Tax=Alteromonas sp. H39 TaxID=3389876 RepID=UPI0039E0B875